MPIVSSVWNAVTQLSGHKSVTARHFDQDGKEVSVRTWLANADADVQSLVDAQAAAITAYLPDEEFRAVLLRGVAALVLKHQTAAEFATRYWNYLVETWRDDPGVRDKLVWWLLQEITAGFITDAQARNSCNSVLGRSYTAATWLTFKTTTLQPIHDRYAAQQGQGGL